MWMFLAAGATGSSCGNNISGWVGWFGSSLIGFCCPGTAATGRIPITSLSRKLGSVLK